MFIIITASPNPDGQTAACGKAAVAGIESSGGQAKLYDISEAKLSPCLICDNGWGSCRAQAKCVTEDILGELQPRIAKSEGLILVTPVYWGQPSERMKYFLDRFRRCEAFQREKGAAAGKLVDLIAAAGGSGNGTATCLSEMETWCRHVHAIPRERIGVTRFNRDHMLAAITDAAARMARV